MCKTKRDRPSEKQQFREDVENKRDHGRHKHMDPYKRMSKHKISYEEYE